jgi:hypothetical protein
MAYWIYRLPCTTTTTHSRSDISICRRRGKQAELHSLQCQPIDSRSIVELGTLRDIETSDDWVDGQRSGPGRHSHC